MSAEWVCQFPSCSSSAAQLAELRRRHPAGFAHDEDPTMRVCTVCRRLPLPAKQEDPPLDESFLAGIKEELASIEESEQNIQALSQVFRFYAGNARQLAQLLVDFLMKQCFPWELIHAFHLLDDILLLDNTGSYKAELSDRIQMASVHTFRKVQSAAEKREVARVLHAWRELRIISPEVADGVAATLRTLGGEAASRILDEASAPDDEDEEPYSMPTRATGPAAAAKGQPQPEPPTKRAKVASAAAVRVAAPTPAQPPRTAEKILALVKRIIAAPAEKPFELLGLGTGCKASEIRTAYRKIALQIHPDKNPGSEGLCKEALIKLQQGREQAESELQQRESGGKSRDKAGMNNATVEPEAKPSGKCPYPGCDLPSCKQCPNRCCTRNITHCHMIARSRGGLHCYFHPPPRSWARNAEG